MKLIGNILWLILMGLFSALAWLLLGCVLCITIIGIPFGLQCFKLARVSLWPFGTRIDTDFAKHPIANAFWIFVCGWELAVGFVLTGVLWCITIIGIPFGKQCFKLATLALTPFGATVR